MLNTTNAKNARTAAKTTIACALAAALALSPAIALAAPGDPAIQPSPAPAQSCFIGMEAARDIALSDAGVLEGGYWDLDVDLDLDMFDGPIHYDVEFKVGSYEHDYDINAVTGEIMSHEIEIVR